MDILEKYLKKSNKIEIEIINNKDKIVNKTGFYKFSSEKYILYRPQNETEFYQNQNVKILIYTKAGIFVFETLIKSLSKKLIEIEKPKNYKTVQRREFLRAEIKIPFVIEIQNKKEKFFTFNISGSGFSFYSDELIDKTKIYNVVLNFTERKINSQIKIIEIRKNLKTNLPKFRYSVQLLSVNNLDENYIIKKCVVENMQTIHF